MFSWIQHLFTLRAIQRENAELLAKVALLTKQNTDLQAQVDVDAKVIAVKDEEIRRITNHFESFKQFHSSKPLVYPNLGLA